MSVSALNGGRTSHERPDFSIPREQPPDAMVVAKGPGAGLNAGSEGFHRGAHDAFIFGASSPLVAIRIEFRRLPWRQDVPTWVTVQVDQPGQNYPRRVQASDTLRRSRGNGANLVAMNDDPTGIECD